MTSALPGQQRFWSKLLDGVKTVFTPTVYQADRQAETLTPNTDGTIEANQKLEESRQQLRQQELALQEFQRQANLEIPAAQSDLNSSLQSELARLTRELQTQEVLLTREFPASEGQKNRKHQEKLARLNRELPAEIAKLKREFQAQEGNLNGEHQVQLEILRANLQQWCIEQQKELQLELKFLPAQLARERRIYHRQTAIEVIQEQKRQNNSPIWLIAEDIVDSNPNQNPIPLRVFLSPPTLRFDGSDDGNDAAKDFPDMEETLGAYLQQFWEKYSAQGRPIEFLSGGWTSKFFHSQVATKSIFRGLKTEPTLILESAAEGDYFNLRFGYWGLNWATYRYKSAITMLPWREVLFELAKERAWRWQEKRDKHIAAGKNAEEFDRRYGMETVKRYRRNLEIMENERLCIEDGEDPREIERLYSIHQNDYNQLRQFIGICHCIIAGLLADEYFLVHVSPEVRQPPLLPQILPDLLQEIPSEEQDKLGEIVVNFYQTLYNVIGQEESAWIAEMRLDLAESLLSLPKKHWAETQILESLKAWLQLKQPGFSEKPGCSAEGELLDALDSALTIDDLDYVDQLNRCLAALGKNRQLSVVDSCYNRGIQRCQEEKYAAAIVDFNQVIQINPNLAEANYNRGLAYAQLGQEQAAIEDYTQVLQLHPNNANACKERANTYYKLGDYERAIADYNQALSINPNLPGVADKRDEAQGVWEEKKQKQLQEEERHQVEAEEKKQKQREEEEAQGQEFHFEIITVNAQGREISRNPGKARQKITELDNGINLEMVYIPGGTFQMGSSESSSEQPIHQVTVKPFFMSKYPITQAQWQAVMGNNPSSFPGAKRPVENVSWQDAVEFCAKLSQKTGKNYRLPSEAEWEYACRAGTTTPFHFGETITPDLVNYDGNNPYASAPTGLYRQETTPVGSFPPNAFGLYDMHGNVWEWCQDVWHENYNGAPGDGSAWETGGADDRVLRGGSWNYYAVYCRSADRFTSKLGDRYRLCGFRVAVGSGYAAFEFLVTRTLLSNL
jgi:formylglycine-generating enzyme required for sulfatase activity